MRAHDGPLACLIVCVCPGATQASGEAAVEREELSTAIPKLDTVPGPWGRVRLGRAGEAGRATGPSAAVASGMGRSLSWCCSACLEQTELINKSRAVDKPRSVAPGRKLQGLCGVEQDQLAWRFGKKKELEWCLLSLDPRKQVFAYNLEG